VNAARLLIPMPQYYKIGKLVSVFGLKGESFSSIAWEKDRLKGLETIFVEEKKDSFLPFSAESE
jgi:16S rRNA processing protein RimM